MGWIKEIEELHAFFEALFLGSETSMDRAEVAFAPGFTFAGPDGTEHDRPGVIEMLHEGRAHTNDLRITTSDHHLVVETDGVLVCTYVEHHHLSTRQTHRLTTAVFVPERSAPNGLQWLRVQETWLPASAPDPAEQTGADGRPPG